MAKKNISADQLISVIISGIEDVKGKEINICNSEINDKAG